jgi:hypothetical protein
MLVYCADGHIRNCYPIISNIIADYEEQALITGIKSGRQCPICQVQPNQRQNISVISAPRTHEQMQARIEKQGREAIERTDPEWVHATENFAWSHHYVNIYESMSVDVLHQLHKGIVMDLINWVVELINGTPNPTRPRNLTERKRSTIPSATLLDDRFRSVPQYTGLKHFKDFSHVRQWTGNQQKAILRVFLPVITPLLLRSRPDALAYARAVADFVTMAQYSTYDEETVRYMKHALSIIDMTKGVFHEQRVKDAQGDAHFNYPKFHAISHYPDFIRKWGAPDGFDSGSMTEAPHKYLLKFFYARTNKDDTYLAQIAQHNTIITKLQAMSCLIARPSTEKHITPADDLYTGTTMARDPINLKEIGWTSTSKDERSRLLRLGFDPELTTIAKDAEQASGLQDFVEALASFVQYHRAALLIRNQGSGVRLHERQTNASWVEKYPVHFHPSLKCWKRDGKDYRDTERLVSERLRCTPAWRRGEERKDHCWVQEFQPTDLRDPYPPKNPLNGQRIGQLQALITVFDLQNKNKNGRYTAYCGALIDIFRLKNKGEPHNIHGMVEIIAPQAELLGKGRNLTYRRFYTLQTILRSAHIIPVSTASNESKEYYVNNYIDWDQYQILYEDEWMTKQRRRAMAIMKSNQARDRAYS